MSGDQIVGCVAIVGMLSLVVPRLVSGRTSSRSLLRMAGLWALIVATIAIVAWALA